MTRLVMVPVHLDALHLTAPTPVVSRTLPYWHLPHHRNGRAYNTDVPFLASAVERDAMHETAQLLAPGVHLHWSLPDALTTQDPQGRFPALPDRWSVYRRGGGLPDRSWLIESDAVRHGPTVDGPASCIAWDRPVPFAWLGVTADTTDTTATPGQQIAPLHVGDRLRPFDVLAGGELLFTAMYSRAGGVFGLHDADVGPDVGFGLCYTLCGHHADPESDPVARLFAEQPETGPALRAQLRWEPADDHAERSAYFAALDFPGGTPHGWGPLAGVDVALGNTSTEALAALHAGGDAHTESVLAALRYLADNGRTSTDLEHALAEFRHNESFHATSGGGRWVLRRRIAAADATTTPVADQRVSGDVAAALRALIDAQRTFDAALRDIERRRAELFAQWCRYLLCAYPHEGARLADFPDIDDVRTGIDTDLLAPLEALVARTGRILWAQGVDDEHVRLALDPAAPGGGAAAVVGRWRALAELLADGADAHLELVLAPGPRYFSPRELSLVLRGDGVAATIRHNADGRLRTDGRLACPAFAVAGTGLHVDDHAELAAWVVDRFVEWTFTDDPSIGFSRPREQSWQPVSLQWSADYEAVAHERVDHGHGPYPPDFLTSYFRVANHEPELQHVEGDPPRSSPVPVRGWSLLTGQADTVLLATLDRYLAEIAVHDVEIPDVLARIDAQLRTARPVLAATLDGLHDALLMYRRGPQLRSAIRWPCPVRRTRRSPTGSPPHWARYAAAR